MVYVNFEPGVEATDSELGPDDIIVRYRGEEIIGLTILHASRRSRINGPAGGLPKNGTHVHQMT